MSSIPVRADDDNISISNLTEISTFSEADRKLAERGQTPQPAPTPKAAGGQTPQPAPSPMPAGPPPQPSVVRQGIPASMMSQTPLPTVPEAPTPAPTPAPAAAHTGVPGGPVSKAYMKKKGSVSQATTRSQSQPPPKTRTQAAASDGQPPSQPNTSSSDGQPRSQPKAGQASQSRPMTVRTWSTDDLQKWQRLLMETLRERVPQREAEILHAAVKRCCLG